MKMDQLNTLKKEILVILKSLKVPGSIVSIRSETYGNMELFYGYSNLEKKIKMRCSKDLLWKIGSVTKTFTGTMILQMLDEGKLKLDNSINTVLFGIPNGKNITIREIGAMRSGIANYTATPEVNEDHPPYPHRVWIPSELLTLGINEPPDFPPSTDFHYSNTNSIILSNIVERLNPKNGGPGSFQEELCRRMLVPLKLHNTNILPLIGRPCIHGYEPNPDGTYKDITNYNESWAWSAGQMNSNLEDLHRYLKLSINKHITISDYAARQQRFWQSSGTVDGVTEQYGFHLLKADNYIGHNGALPGYSCSAFINPKTKTSIVVMCNIRATLDEINPSEKITHLVIRTLK